MSELILGTNPLDLWDVFINQITGDPTGVLFMAFMLIITATICAKLRIPNDTTLIIFIIFGLLMSPFFQGILVLTMLAVAFFLSWALSKIVGRYSG